jgi:hypothetical protein
LQAVQQQQALLLLHMPLPKKADLVLAAGMGCFQAVRQRYSHLLPRTPLPKTACCWLSCRMQLWLPQLLHTQQ